MTPWNLRKPGALAHLALAAVLLQWGCSDGASPTEVRVVAITPSAGLAVGIGATVLFSAQTLDRYGDATYAREVEWLIGDPAVATIDAAGLAVARTEGVTTISAIVGGVTGTASLEVYVPEAVASYVPGTSYLGRAGYVEYIPGELPVVLSAPHGGRLTPQEIPNRSFGVTGADRNTIELTLAVRDALVDLTGYAPYVVLSHLHRVKLDPNREIVEAAQGNAFAEHAWEEFQGFIEIGRGTVEQAFGGGMYFDMHGHGHARNRLELGYLLTSAQLNQPDDRLNSLAIVQMTSIREIGRARPTTFAAVIRGTTSLGGFLEQQGVPVLPSPGDPFPLTDPYFSGGYNTRRHGSIDDTELISGIQIEHHFPGLRDTDQNRRAYAAQLAVAVSQFVNEHFGFFEPTP